MSIDKLDEAVKRVMGEILCPYPRPSHEHDELDCRVCALERRVRAALDEAVAANTRTERAEAAMRKAYGAALAIQAHGCTPQRLDLLFAAIEELRP